MYNEKSPNYLSIIKNKYITEIPEKKEFIIFVMLYYC